MTDPGCRRQDRRAIETQQSRPGLPNGAGETDMTNGGSEALSSSFRARRLIPLALLLAALVAFFLFGLEDWLDLEMLRRHRLWLTAQVEAHFLPSLLTYMAVYAIAVAISVPGGAALTIAGGFLFGQLVGCATTVVAATIGACALFLAARSALGDPFRARAGPWLKRLQAGFKENALSYMLVLRLVPLFPFFVVNLVPAFLGVPFRTYLIGTFFGIIPGTFVFAAVGAGLGQLFEAGGDIDTADVLTPQIVIALVGLALLALLPVAYKKLIRRRA
jgi:uncharacterized membrane protein YdjX (TVP38/TMEM64 family)